jgi:hypothetical protein
MRNDIEREKYHKIQNKTYKVHIMFKLNI